MRDILTFVLCCLPIPIAVFAVVWKYRRICAEVDEEIRQERLSPTMSRDLESIATPKQKEVLQVYKKEYFQQWREIQQLLDGRECGKKWWFASIEDELSWYREKTKQQRTLMEDILKQKDAERLTQRSKGV